MVFCEVYHTVHCDRDRQLLPTCKFFMQVSIGSSTLRMAVPGTLSLPHYVHSKPQIHPEGTRFLQSAFPTRWPLKTVGIIGRFQ